MAKLTREDFISALKEMTILEIKDLVDAMKEEFGSNKIQVIKIVRDLTGLGLKEAKEIADNGGNVKEGIDKEEAEKIKAQFEEAGASVELK